MLFLYYNVIIISSSSSSSSSTIVLLCIIIISSSSSIIINNIITSLLAGPRCQGDHDRDMDRLQKDNDRLRGPRIWPSPFGGPSRERGDSGMFYSIVEVNVRAVSKAATRTGL